MLLDFIAVTAWIGDYTVLSHAIKSLSKGKIEKYLGPSFTINT